VHAERGVIDGAGTEDDFGALDSIGFPHTQNPRMGVAEIIYFSAVSEAHKPLHPVCNITCCSAFAVLKIKARL
jgi:hypothetical protein